MNRSGVALLITLVFIAAMMALTAVFFGLSGRAFERVNEREATLQTNALLFDLKHEVVGELIGYARTRAETVCAAASDKAGCERETMAAILDGFYGLPLTLQTGSAATVLSCLPAGTAIDINSLKLPADSKTPAADVHYRRTKVERHLQDVHRLYATWQLFELLDYVFDETEQRYPYLKNDTRLNIAADRFERGRIGSPRQLRAIIEDYALLSNDNAALEVPWEELFVFEGLKTGLDFDHLSQTACRIVFAQTPSACERIGQYPAATEISALSQEANASIRHFLMTFGYNPVLDCRVTYRNGENNHRFSFGYNADSGRLFGFKMGL